MELFIQIQNGQPYEHPILGDNFRAAFPDVDTNNLPPQFARFVRVACPNKAGVYEVDEVSYQWVDGVVKDVWSIRQMTNEERLEKINKVLANQPFLSWVFDESSCSWKPPAPYPEDGKVYRWDEAITNWVEGIFNQGV